MQGPAPDRVRRISVTDPIAAAGRYHYNDAFELRLEAPDRCSPEEWVHARVDATPAWIKRIAGHADGLGSACIVDSDADVVLLEDSDALMDTVMVGRNVEPERSVLTTVLRYRRPLPARAVWAKTAGQAHATQAECRSRARGRRCSTAPRAARARATATSCSSRSRATRPSHSGIAQAAR
jgi:hypothetical protein